MYLQYKNFGYNFSARSNHHEGKHKYITHFHQFYEVVCVLKGSVEITVDGKTEIANAGDMAVILPFHHHSYHTPEYCKCWVGLISGDWINEFIPNNTYMSTDKCVFTPSETLFNYVCERIPPPHTVLNENSMSKELFRKTKAIYSAIFEEYLEEHPLTFSNMRSTTAISAIFIYANEHFKEDISLKSAAEAIGYTPTYISHCLAEIPHINFRLLLNTLRVDHAKKLLISTDKKILDIAFECGFNSESLFHSTFKKLTGITPAGYKAKRRAVIDVKNHKF